jgi:hypothetical protein
MKSLVMCPRLTPKLLDHRCDEPVGLLDGGVGRLLDRPPGALSWGSGLLACLLPDQSTVTLASSPSFFTCRTISSRCSTLTLMVEGTLAWTLRGGTVDAPATAEPGRRGGRRPVGDGRRQTR